MRNTNNKGQPMGTSQAQRNKLSPAIEKILPAKKIKVHSMGQSVSPWSNQSVSLFLLSIFFNEISIAASLYNDEHTTAMQDGRSMAM
jgi:hypothetical protein